MSGTTFSSVENRPAFFLETAILTQEFVSDILIYIQNMPTAERLEFHRNRDVMKLTHDVSQFVELTTLLTKAVMQFKKATIIDFKNSHVHLLFIVKAMIQSNQKADLIALEDLIKYELKDNLTQWKIDLIPQIKRLLST
jgi:hypothetical protein